MIFLLKAKFSSLNFLDISDAYTVNTLYNIHGTMPFSNSLGSRSDEISSKLDKVNKIPELFTEKECNISYH